MPTEPCTDSPAASRSDRTDSHIVRADFLPGRADRRGLGSAAGAPADLASDAAACSIQRTLDLIGDRWTLLILRDVFRGVRRFSHLHNDLGIARNLLSDRLQALVAAEILCRVPYQSRPLRHEYQLTPKGRDLSTALVALMHWGDHWCHDGEAPTELVHADCHTQVQLQPWCRTCSRAVPPSGIRSRPGRQAGAGSSRGAS